MGNIIYKDNKVYCVFGAAQEFQPMFLIFLNGKWEWVEAKCCVPHYTSSPQINS